MAKSTKKAVTKAPASAAQKSAASTPKVKGAKAKTRAPRVRTGVADDIRAFLKQAGNPATLAQLNAALNKTHSAASIYAALQYMGRRNEIARKGRGAQATFTVKAATAAKPDSAPKPESAPKKRRGRKAKATRGPAAPTHAAAPAALNFGSMIAELKRVADSAEKAIVQHAMNSTDRAIRALAEMAADMRAKAAKFSM